MLITVILLLFRNMNGKNLILFVKVTDPPDVLEYLGMSVKFLIFVEVSHVKNLLSRQSRAGDLIFI